MTTILQFPCPHCGGSITRSPAPRASRKPATADGLRDDMSDSERFAYFKRTADAADLARFLRPDNTLSDALRARAKAITKPTKAIMRSLYAAWRIERSEADRMAGVPAVGSESWRDEIVAEGHVETVMAS